MPSPLLLPVDWETSGETTFRAQKQARPPVSLSVFAMTEAGRLAATHPGFELVELKKISSGAVAMTYRMPAGGTLVVERMLVVDRDGEYWTIRFEQAAPTSDQMTRTASHMLAASA